jgi:hypothetical protein
MKNQESLNNKKSKMKQKQNNKVRGYYYSSANINKRQALKKQLDNQNNDIPNNNLNDDFFPKKKNNSNFNKDDNINNNKNIIASNIKMNKINLELYNKNMLLLEYIESKRKDFNIVLNKLKIINKNIGNMILKPKIKNSVINKMMIREKEQKEQEEINFNKNISEKIDAALNKANLALDNIKYLGKNKNQKIQNNINNSNNNDINSNLNTKYNYNEFKKEKEKINLFNIAQKCLDKYEDNININKNNHDEYFITISKSRKLFKDAKEQLQSTKYRLRNSGVFFDEIFNKNKKKNNEEQITLIKLGNTIFLKENIFIRINSFLKSEIFKKLFIRVIFNENFIHNQKFQSSNNKYNNTEIYNIFSLWYMIKELICYIEQNNNNNIDINFSLVDRNINEVIFNKNKDNNSMNIFFKHHIYNLIDRYLSFLNRKNNNSNIHENQIFTNDYYKLYEIFFKLEQSKIAEFIAERIENSNTYQNIISKEELNYYKNIQSIITNKGKYVCSIINK